MAAARKADELVVVQGTATSPGRLARFPNIEASPTFLVVVSISELADVETILRSYGLVKQVYDRGLAQNINCATGSFVAWRLEDGKPI